MNNNTMMDKKHPKIYCWLERTRFGPHEKDSCLSISPSFLTQIHQPIQNGIIIPKQFSDSFLGNCSRGIARLQGPSGKIYSVKLKTSQSLIVLKGQHWVSFAGYHSIKTGDGILLTYLGSGTFQVRIFSSGFEQETNIKQLCTVNSCYDNPVNCESCSKKLVHGSSCHPPSYATMHSHSHGDHWCFHCQRGNDKKCNGSPIHSQQIEECNVNAVIVDDSLYGSMNLGGSNNPAYSHDHEDVCCSNMNHSICNLVNGANTMNNKPNAKSDSLAANATENVLCLCCPQNAKKVETMVSNVNRIETQKPANHHIASQGHDSYDKISIAISCDRGLDVRHIHHVYTEPVIKRENEKLIEKNQNNSNDDASVDAEDKSSSCSDDTESEFVEEEDIEFNLQQQGHIGISINPEEGERQCIVKKANEFKSQYPVIRKKLKLSFYQKMTLPKRFVVQYMPQEDIDIKLLDPERREWNCRWLGHERRRNSGRYKLYTPCISKGWRDFALVNELKIHDIILLELIDPKMFQFKVHIYRS